MFRSRPIKILSAIAALGALSAVGACESVDDYVGQTIDTFSDGSNSRLAAKAPTRRPNAAPAPASGPTIKTRPTTKAPAGQVAIIKSAQARVQLALRILNGGVVSRRRFSSADGRYVEEDAHWTGPGPAPVTAGVLLSESRTGPPITDAKDPAGIVDHWATFRGQQRTFGNLIGSKNVLGPVLWRRSRVGTTTCVAFLQRWSQNPPNGPTSTLSGYYCAAPGEALSPGEAETVVQALGISAPSG